MTNELRALRDAESAARESLRAIEEIVGGEKTRAVGLIDRWFGAELKAATAAHSTAKAARVAQEEVEALAEATPPWPVGTVVRRWEKLWIQTTAAKTHALTDDIGTIEVVTRESRFADNLSSYSRPRVGSVIVRLQKKNGTPSLKFAELLRGIWRPEGIDYNAELHAAKIAEKQAAEESARRERDAKLAAAAEVFGL